MGGGEEERERGNNNSLIFLPPTPDKHTARNCHKQEGNQECRSAFYAVPLEILGLCSVCIVLPIHACKNNCGHCCVLCTTGNLTRGLTLPGSVLFHLVSIFEQVIILRPQCFLRFSRSWGVCQSHCNSRHSGASLLPLSFVFPPSFVFPAIMLRAQCLRFAPPALWSSKRS